MSENPYESSTTGHAAVTMNRKPLFTLGGVILSGAIVLLVIALLLPAVRSGKGPSLKNSCMNNLKQISLALLNYHDEHGTFPPAYTVDAEGNRLHSWRTLLLPYIEGLTLHKMIDYDKPWDDPANAEARKVALYCYSCPAADNDDGTLANYLAVVGPEFAFNGTETRSLTDFEDGPNGTIMVIEVDSRNAVHWMSPYDADEEMVMALGPDTRTNHRNVTMAAFADGHAEAVSLDVDRDALRAMLTIAGGESVPAE